MHYGTLSFKLSVKYNLATLRINYVTALEKPGSSTLTVKSVSAHKGGTPLPQFPLPQESERRGTGLVLCPLSISHLDPQQQGSLRSDQGVGLRAGVESYF